MAGPKNFDNQEHDDAPELTREDIFAGADGNDADDDISAADRGDDPNAEQLAAPEPDDDTPEVEASEPDDEVAEVEETTVEATDVAEAEGDEVVLEADDATVEEDEDDEPKVSPYVTKDRFNAVNERMQLAEQALRDAQQQAESAELAKSTPVEAFDFNAQELAYMELVTDGEFEKAQAVRASIRDAERAEYAASQVDNSTSAAQITEQITFSEKVAELSAEYDLFNPEHDNYDQVLVDDTVDRRDLFVARGMTMADALDKAAREVAKLYDIESNFEKAADAEIAKMEADKTPAAKKADVAKKIAMKESQPSKMDEGKSVSADEKSVMQMNDAEYEALPEATKARIRGDIV